MRVFALLKIVSTVGAKQLFAYCAPPLAASIFPCAGTSRFPSDPPSLAASKHVHGASRIILWGRGLSMSGVGEVLIEREEHPLSCSDLSARLSGHN